MQQHDIPHSDDSAASNLTDETPREATNPQDATSTPQSDGPESDGDVLDIIAEVERHLQKIRTVQASQEQELLSLAERSDALSTAEQELQQHAEQLRQQQAALDQRSQALETTSAELDARSTELEQTRAEFEQTRASLREEQDAFSTRQTEAEETLAARERKLEEATQALKDRAEKFKAEQTALTQATEQLEQDRAAMQERAVALEQERDELQQRVEQAERNVGELISKLEEREQALNDRTQAAAGLDQQIAEKTAELEAQSDALQSMEKELASLREKAGADEAALTAAREELESLKQHAADTARHEKEFAEELEASQQRIEELTQHYQSTKSALEQREAELAGAKQKLSLATEKLQSFASTLEQQSPLLEKGAAAMAQVHQQKKEIELLTREVAKLRASTDTSEIERRDDRIAELTAALRQARGQVAGGGGDAARYAEQIESLNSELDQARAEFERANIRIEQMTEAARSGGDDESVKLAIAERDARIQKLTATIDSLERELEEATAPNANDEEDDGNAAGAEELESLRQRIAELEEALEQTRTSGASGGPASEKLREQAQRVNRVAEHVKRRRERLRRMRKLLRLQAGAARTSAPSASRAPSTTADHEALARERHALERQRAELDAVREALAASERQMVRKWARPRAITMMVWVIALIVANVAGSWYLADHFFPAMHTASVELSPKTRAGESLPAAAEDPWQDWHIATLADENFRRTIARRMSERRLDDFSRPASLGRYLDEHLTVLKGDGGTLTLTLAGRQTGTLQPALDVIASTLVEESGRQAGARGDGAWAVIENERATAAGEPRYASLNEWTLEDERVMYSGIFFAGTFTLSLILIWFIYTRLVRAKRIFDEDNVLIATEPIFEDA